MNTSLLYKSKYGAFLNSSNNGGGKNRYERLLVQINDQLPEIELEESETYSLALNWFARRSLRSALSYIVRQPQTLLDALAEDQITERAIVEKGRMTPSSQFEFIRESQKQRLASLGLRASFLLNDLGYLNPQKNLNFFGVNGHYAHHV